MCKKQQFLTWLGLSLLQDEILPWIKKKKKKKERRKEEKKKKTEVTTSSSQLKMKS